MTARTTARKAEVETDRDGTNSDLAERVDAEITAHEEKIADYESQIVDRERQITDFRDKIRAAQLVITKLKRIRRQVGSILAAPQGGPVSKEASKAPLKHRSSGRRYRPGSDAYIVLTVARDAIRAAGRPLDRNQIIAAIEASGHRLKSMNPEQYVNKVMWGSEEFRNVGDGYDFSGTGNSKE
jgi:hypothetical protein